jgi:hypothetical protein
VTGGSTAAGVRVPPGGVVLRAEPEDEIVELASRHPEGAPGNSRAILPPGPAIPLRSWFRGPGGWTAAGRARGQPWASRNYYDAWEKGGGVLLARRITVGSVAAIATALVVGIPTGIVETSWYHRMTPVLWWNYPVWVMSAALTGALVATYVRDPAAPVPATQSGNTFLGGMLSLFAVGCPICNKLVVMAIGVSGALNWFAPIQPLLAVGSLGLLAYALWARRRTAIRCRIQPQTAATAATATPAV